ncbi:NUDIX domain-containing protein [Niveibacterium sp.]|uniref:NUDIX domain-containing protein n=1 Tax=Niveibacterium sp. TaxID=2017444 RepID=UPI0035B4C748
MSDPNPFIEHTISSEQVFDGKLLKVWRDRVGRESEPGEWNREYIRHPGATVIIAVTESGKLLMERQFRYPLGHICWEMPAGKIDPNESIEVCARRELREETGFEASDWSHLGTVHPCVGYSDERIEIFLAQGLTQRGAALDHGEYVEVFEITLDEAEAAVLDGRITDGKTIACLFWAAKTLRR